MEYKYIPPRPNPELNKTVSNRVGIARFVTLIAFLMFASGLIWSSDYSGFLLLSGIFLIFFAIGLWSGQPIEFQPCSPPDDREEFSLADEISELTRRYIDPFDAYGYSEIGKTSL